MAGLGGWKAMWPASGRFIAHSLCTYELVFPFVCELSGEGVAKGGFKGQEVCMQSVVVLRSRKWWWYQNWRARSVICSTRGSLRIHMCSCSQ